MISTLFQKVTYIYVIDVSASTKNSAGSTNWCGDANGDSSINQIIDCEILALAKANDAARSGGNVDLVGLVQFNNASIVLQGLMAPWERVSNVRRDAAIIDKARSINPTEATNYQAAVEVTCAMARSAANTNDYTVVIFVSDGAPNLGTSAKSTIQTNCGKNTIFQTYAVTSLADCNAIDTVNLGIGADPDTLNEIATFSGGTCTKVPDVSVLPDLLADIEKTIWNGVAVTANSVIQNATVGYNRTVPYSATRVAGSNGVTYSGSVPLAAGEYNLCTEATSTTSGVVSTKSSCKSVVILTLEAIPSNQTKVVNEQASFSIRFVGNKTGCTSPQGKQIEIKDCTGKSISTLTTDAIGEVKFMFTNTTPTVSCFKACFLDQFGNDSCTTATVTFQVRRFASWRCHGSIIQNQMLVNL